MIRNLISTLLLLVATTAWAEDFPALYDVTNVAANDVLNIRSGPSVGAEVIGSLPGSAANIEVIRATEDRKWGMIGLGEQNGWVSLSYMFRHPGQAAGDPPRITACYGTEPFWSLTVGPETTLSHLGNDDKVLGALGIQSSANRIDRFLINTSDPGVSAVLLQQACSDGMSDRTYGIAIEMFSPHGDTDGATALYSGCCTIQP